MRHEAQTLGTNKKCLCLFAGCREATVKAVSIIKALEGDAADSAVITISL